MTVDCAPVPAATSSAVRRRRGRLLTLSVDIVDINLHIELSKKDQSKRCAARCLNRILS